MENERAGSLAGTASIVSAIPRIFSCNPGVGCWGVMIKALVQFTSPFSVPSNKHFCVDAALRHLFNIIPGSCMSRGWQIDGPGWHNHKLAGLEYLDTCEPQPLSRIRVVLIKICAAGTEYSNTHKRRLIDQHRASTTRCTEKNVTHMRDSTNMEHSPQPVYIRQ